MAKRNKSEKDAEEIEDFDENDGLVEEEQQPVRSNKIVTARVKAGNRVTLMEKGDDGEPRERMYGAGATVKVSEEDIRIRPWAFEVGERRRSGQTARLQKKVDELKAEIERLKAEQKTAGKPDPNRAAAVESILARGDNYSGRGEPSLGSVPREVVEAHERGIDLSIRQPVGPTLDEETGYKGIGREQASVSGETRTASVSGGSPSNPSTLEPGQSQRPGDNEPSDV